MSDPEARLLKRKLLLIGGGGHCASVLDSAISAGTFDEIGIVDFADSSCLGVSVIGTDDDIPNLRKDGWNCAIVTVGSVGNTKLRRRLFWMIQQYCLTIPTIIDPTAVIAKGTTIGEGCFIGKNAVVNTGAVTGNIMGALIGFEAIDAKWKEDLELCNVILEMADDLCHGCRIATMGGYYDREWEDKYMNGKRQ